MWQELLVVVAEFRQHFLGREEFLVAVVQALVFGDVTDRAEGRAADFAGAFR